VVGNWLRSLHSPPYARRQPLVLINGLTEQPESWFRNLGYWRRHFDVHPPNLLIYDGPALHRRIDAGLPISIDYLVEELHRYLHSYVQTPPYHLVAASLGGKVAVEYAARRPEQVSRLVLLCPSGMGDKEHLPLVEGVRRSDLKSLVESVFWDPRAADPDLLAYYRRQFANRRWRLGLLRTIRGTRDHSVRDRLAQVPQPTLLISGREDRIVDPRTAAEAAKRLPQGHHLFIPQCGHAPQMEKLWLVNRLVVRFLTSPAVGVPPPRPQGGEGRKITPLSPLGARGERLLPSPPWGRGVGGEGKLQPHKWIHTMPILEQLAGKPLVRRLTEAFLERYARQRAGHLDSHPAGPVQEKTLLRLVRRARRTRFGRDHDFGRIRCLADYQDRVPLRDYETFWSEYWRPTFPILDNVSWTGLIPYFALSSGTTSGATKYIPVSRAMLKSNRRAALTALAFFLAAYPATPLCSGRLFFLGGSTDLQVLTRSPPPVRAGDLSGIVASEVSPLLRPYTFPPLDLALLTDWDEKMDRLAEQSAALPITLLSGVPSWLLVLFDRLRQITGKEHVAEVWPQLRLVLHGGTRFDPYRKLFRERIGNPGVHFLDTYPASEGYVASEDPRHGLLRLLPDHDVFFEFVPCEEVGNSKPVRHTAASVQPGVRYAVVLTTCAGLWSYILGDTICFECREPPLLRFTGRTKDYLSAFGEHLIGDEVERAVAAAAEAAGTAVVDFHAGPVFPEASAAPSPQPLSPGGRGAFSSSPLPLGGEGLVVRGRHRFLVEFAVPAGAGTVAVFARALDAALGRLNDDYTAHRRGDLTMLAPEVWPVPPGGFAAWLRSRGRLGGQHKVPRLDSTGALTAQLSLFFRSSLGSNHLTEKRG
jgi:pimeloyl-ACP methyl ester carboxylesterase